VTITCATIEAAAQVLTVLIRANLGLGFDYDITPLDAPIPIRITVRVNLPLHMLRQFRAIPDTTIA
jgi:hypothetical protein